MKNKPIGFVLTLWYTGAFIVLMSIFGTVTYYLMHNTLLANVDSTLKQSAAWAKQLYAEEKSHLHQQYGDIVLPDSVVLSSIINEIIDEYEENIIGIDIDNLFIFDRDGNTLYRNSLDSTIKFRLPLSSIVSKDQILTHRQTNSRILIFPVEKFSVLMGKTLDPMDKTTGALLKAFIIVIPFLLIIAVIGGYVLTKKTLKPVDVITKTVGAISSENLSARVPERHVDDELGRLINTLNLMLQKLEDSFNRLLQFSSDASHELQTPFTIIRNTIDSLIRKRIPDKDQMEVFIKLENEIIRASEIVNSLLLLNKIDQKKEELQLLEFGLDQLFKDIIEDTEILARRKNISVTCGNVEPIDIRADEHLIRRLFLNLIDNAVKFTPAGGEISLSLAEDSGSAVIIISDTGTGIPREHIAKIFERFYRVEQSRSRSFGGAGLGLSICKWIVEAHQGNITVSSEIKRGTTIEITLPLE